MKLPEKLRNLGIVPYNPNEKVKVTLSDEKVNSLADILFTAKASKGA